MKEFTFKALLMGSIFGILFGASTVYLALKAGITVSASIPIAVLAIALGRRLFKTTILENNIIQTTGSASESIAAGVVFTLPGFLFLSTAEAGNYFNYAVIFILAIFGGMLGTLLMIPLRRSLIVKEHETLPYPEGTACASVLNGDLEAAVDHLARVLKSPTWPMLNWIASDNDLDPLRQLPRFKALVADAEARLPARV